MIRTQRTIIDHRVQSTIVWLGMSARSRGDVAASAVRRCAPNGFNVISSHIRVDCGALNRHIYRKHVRMDICIFDGNGDGDDNDIDCNDVNDDDIRRITLCRVVVNVIAMLHVLARVSETFNLHSEHTRTHIREIITRSEIHASNQCDTFRHLPVSLQLDHFRLYGNHKRIDVSRISWFERRRISRYSITVNRLLFVCNYSKPGGFRQCGLSDCLNYTHMHTYVIECSYHTQSCIEFCQKCITSMRF